MIGDVMMMPNREPTISMALLIIIFPVSLKDYDYLEGVVDICEKSGVHTKFIPDYSSLIPSRPYTSSLFSGRIYSRFPNVPRTFTPL